MAEAKKKRSHGPAVLLPDPDELAEAEIIERAELPEGRFDFRTSLRTSLLWSLGGAAGWAMITYLTGYNIGLIALAIGFLAGMGAARGGRSKKAQKIGAACAALGYFVGQMGGFLALLISQRGMPSLSGFIVLVPLLLYVVVKTTFTGLNVVFLGIAIYEGYRIPGPSEQEAKE